jgi:dolichyl-phosphooligosaccharide-protein glycotransferase
MADEIRRQPNFLRTAIWLGLFVLVGFALRSAFVVDIGFDEESGRHLFTGNDPYYHWRTTDHVIQTGQNMDFDPAINYPEGRDNPNPPLWTWTSALVAVAFQSMGVVDPVGTALNVMVAVWGALCVIPIFLITRDLWGRRAALWASFFMAVSAPHIQRSVWGYADHDAISMFFILLAFAFMIRAFKSMRMREYVEHWNRWAAVKSGVGLAMKQNRDSLLWAALAGVSVTACAVTWKGYPYVFGIIALAAFLHLVLDHLRNRDSTVTWLIYTIVIGVGTLLPWLIYYQFQPNQLASTVFPSLYVLYGVILLGLVLVPTRDLPSILVFPAMALGAVLAVLYLMAFQPGIWGAISSGLGYFQQSKLYSTIAEAQRPQLGEVAASLGFFTFLLAFWGLFRTMRMGLRGDGPNILVASWAVVAMFMMFAAARFEVNAAPLFAVLLGYGLDRIVGYMGMEEVRKRFRSQHGQNPVARSFRSLSWKPVLIGLAVGFFLVLPNAWLGVDAAIPYEYEERNNLVDYSRSQQTGNFLNPPRFGAFGVGFSDIAGQERWSAVMQDLSKLDTCRSDPVAMCTPGQSDYLPLEERCAFVGWWDYGHWAVALGMHPTMADPFQSHFELSGRVLASDSEEEAAHWLTILLLNGDRARNGGQFSAPVRSLLERTNPDLLQMTGGNQHNYDVLVGNLTVDAFEFHDAVQEATGKCIGYLGVSSRMYPAGGAGIFYAPVYLADKNPDDYIETRLQANFPSGGTKILTVSQYEMVDGRSVRLDNIRFTDPEGKEYVEYQGYLYPKGQSPLQGYSTATGAPYEPSQYQQSQPTARFESSLFNRAFGGSIIPGAKNAQGLDIGQASGSGLAHWRTISETSSAQALQDGTPVQARGVVLLAYYRGVTVEGTLVDDAGEPMAGYTVTFRDGFGATHHRATTDSQGRFSVIAPFSQGGDLSLVVQGGSQALFTYEDPRIQYTFAQARRGETDTGLTVTVPRGIITGRIYEDVDGNATFNAGDKPLAGAVVSLTGGRFAVTDEDGFYALRDVPAGEYSLVAGKYPEYANSTARPVTVASGQQAELSIPLTVRPVPVAATFLDASGAPVAALTMEFTGPNGTKQFGSTDSDGIARTSLVPGMWEARVNQTLTTTGEDGSETSTLYQGSLTFEVRRGETQVAVTVRQQ